MKLKLRRTSVMPNKFGSYAYEVLDSEKPEVAELLERASGVFDGTEGGKVIFSLNRLGKTNVPFTCDIRLVKQKGTDNEYINLVDNSLDLLAEVGNKYKAAARFGEGFAQAFANVGVAALFAGTVKAEPVAAGQAAAAATPAASAVEEPVAGQEIGAQS